jgi:hypothetical protein
MNIALCRAAGTIVAVLFLAGTPAELSISISGQDIGSRILGSYSGGNSSAQQPRFLVSGPPQGAPNAINLQAFKVPGIGNAGPYPRNYLRNPGFNNHDLSVFKNFPVGATGRRYLQLRLEAFNVFNIPQFSGVNRTTSLTTQDGLTGANVFNSYNNLQITTNTRPPGSTAPLGQYFGEYNNARDPRIIQLGVKMYF